MLAQCASFDEAYLMHVSRVPYEEFAIAHWYDHTLFSKYHVWNFQFFTRFIWNIGNERPPSYLVMASYSAAMAIRDIELEQPCAPDERDSTPLFGDENGQPAHRAGPAHGPAARGAGSRPLTRPVARSEAKRKGEPHPSYRKSTSRARAICAGTASLSSLLGFEATNAAKLSCLLRHQVSSRPQGSCPRRLSPAAQQR